MKHRFYSPLSLLLVCLLLLIPLMTRSARAQSTENKEGPRMCAPCGIIIGITVLVTGGYIAYELWQLCQRKLPPTPPPPPPPPVVTNQPPTVNTNMPPGATNRLSKLSINPVDVTSYAIEAYGYTAPDGSVYNTMLKVDLVTSFDLQTWQRVPIVAYLSDTSVLTQVGTNGASIQPLTYNWELDIGMRDTNAPMKFVRSATP